MSELECCIECDQPTGRAGRGEDSLLLAGEGPYCESCYEEWPDQKVEQLSKLRQQLTAVRDEAERLRWRVSQLESAVPWTIYGDNLTATVLRKQAEAIEEMSGQPKRWEPGDLYIYAQRLRARANELEQNQ